MAKPICITEACSIALHTLVYMAKNPSKRVKIKDVARIMEFSEAHLAKVMQKLVRSNLINSSRGPDGGFYLSKPPENISFLDVYESIEGKLMIGKCPMNYDSCYFKKCIFNDFFSKVILDFSEFLGNKNLQDTVGYF